MPYKTVEDLPESVRAHLPLGAQKIYKEVFNHAFKQYETRADREELVHKVAWSAVKKKYEKGEDGKWHLKK